MKKLTIAVIVAALAWAGFWFWSASAQKSAIARWFEDRRNAGWAADYSDVSVRGFPNRLDTTLGNPRLGDPENGLLWDSGFLQILRLSYDPSHLILVWDNAQAFATPTSETTVTTTDMRASVELATARDWQAERIIVVAEGLSVNSTEDWSLTSNVSQLSFEAMPDDTSSYRVALDARGLSGVLPGWVDGSGTARIDRATVDAEISLSAPLDRRAVENGRPQPQQIRLALAEATWDGITLAAAGTLDVTETGTPLGKITLQIRNWREAIAKERQGDRLSARALNQIEFTLGVIAGLSGNPETLDLPFDFQNGQIWLGPLNLGPAPRLFLP